MPKRAEGASTLKHGNQKCRKLIVFKYLPAAPVEPLKSLCGALKAPLSKGSLLDSKRKKCHPELLHAGCSTGRWSVHLRRADWYYFPLAGGAVGGDIHLLIPLSCVRSIFLLCCSRCCKPALNLIPHLWTCRLLVADSKLFHLHTSINTFFTHCQIQVYHKNPPYKSLIQDAFYLLIWCF